MLLTILIGFFLLVVIIGLITAKFNVKTPCDHQWEEDDHQIKCSKCFRAISKTPAAIHEAYFPVGTSGELEENEHLLIDAE